MGESSFSKFGKNESKSSLVFQIPEVVENVLKFLDNKALLEVRLVSRILNEESIKILENRKYQNEVPVYDACNDEDFQQFEVLLEQSQIPEMLMGKLLLNLNYWTSDSHPHFQKIITNHGSLIQKFQLHIETQFNQILQEKFASLLSLLPNIQMFSLNFNIDPIQYVIPEVSFKSPLKYKNLSSFNFTFLGGEWLITSIQPFVQIFTEIINSTQKLKNLEIGGQNFATFLNPISENPETLEKLKFLKSLSFEDRELRFDSANQAEPNQQEICKVLSVVSKSLETFALFGYTNHGFSISSLPHLPNLRTLITEGKTINPHCIMNLSTSFKTPKLNLLMVGNIVRAEGYLWPLVGKKSVCELKWREDSQLGGVNLNKKGKPQKETRNELTVIFSADRTRTVGWVDGIIDELAKMRVTNLFLNLEEAGGDVKGKVLYRCLTEIPGLKSCVLCSGIDEQNNHVVKTYVVPQP